MYLIYGESYRLIDEEIARIIKDQTNIVSFDLTQSTIEDVITEATYVSMFEEKKYILVKNSDFFAADKADEEAIELLLNYMEHPVNLTEIIFITYQKIDMRKKITKSFNEKYKIINVGNMKPDDLIVKAKNFARQNGFTIGTDEIRYIMNCCYNNYDLIYNELNKLFLYYNEPQEIKMEDIQNIVSKSLTDNNFKFVEAVIEKNMPKVLSILEDLYTLKVDPIVLLMLLAREYRLMLSVQILMSNGYRKNIVSKELGLQDWQVDKILRSNGRYYTSELEENLKQLANIDFQIKSGKLDKYLGLKLFLLQLN